MSGIKLMPLKLRPTGLGSGIDKDRADYTVLTGEWEIGAHLSNSRRSREPALVLVADRQRSDDALGSRGDVRESQGAVSEKLGRLEGVGEAARGAVAFGTEPTKGTECCRLLRVNL